MERLSAPVALPELDRAIAQGLAYLHGHQLANGEFNTYCTSGVAMQGWCEPDSCVFPTLLIAGNLRFLAEAPLAEEILARVPPFLLSQAGRGGLWNYFTVRNRSRDVCPADADDTACASEFLRSRGLPSPSVQTIPFLLANRDPHGLFYTWFLLRWKWVPYLNYWRVMLAEFRHPLRSLGFWRKVETSRAAVDVVVNANVLYFLGDRPETQPIVSLILRTVAEGKEAACDVFYLDPLIVYYFFTRNYARGITQLEPIRQPVIERILAVAQPDGRLGSSVVETAAAVCALLDLRAEPPELERAIRFLLGSQQPAGEWPRWSFYYGGPSRGMSWGSAELTTGFCLEALARYRTLRMGLAPG